MQRRLARLDQARKEFIANASHELRTPIFSLGGFVELLQDEDIDESTRAEFLATMREQVDRLQKLTTDLLDLSRLDAGSLEVELEPVPLLTLARPGRGRVRRGGGEAEGHDRGVGAGPQDDVEARVRPDARRADPARAARQRAHAHRRRARRSRSSRDRRATRSTGAPVAELTVTDDGPGIPPERAAERVRPLPHRRRRRRARDSGLAIARELAERMLGRLRGDLPPRQDRLHAHAARCARPRRGVPSAPLDTATPRGRAAPRTPERTLA